MKILFRSILIILTTISIFSSCIDPFEPDINRYESVYVVDGEISNLAGPYIIRVSQSSEYGEQDSIMITGANVTIQDDQNNTVRLTEVKDGVYSTVNSDFRGVPGRSYQLRIEISEDVILESDFEKMMEPVEIKDIYWEFRDRTSYAGVTGLELFLDSELADNNTGYYSWEYEEYWKFEVPFYNDAFPDEKICWDSSMIHPIVLGTTTGFSENAVKRKSLFFISDQTTRLSARYTTLVKQYVINEKAYHFFKDLQALNENTGGLFDPIPFSLQGNMHHVDNPDIPVLGLFQVAGVSQKRIYIDVDDVPNEVAVQDLSASCQKQSARMDDTDLINTLLNGLYIPYDSIVAPGDTIPTIYFASQEICFKCTASGTNKPPDFWEE